MTKVFRYDELENWSFLETQVTHQTFNRRTGSTNTSVRPRKGYAYPDDPSLMGEVIIRGVIESA